MCTLMYMYQCAGWDPDLTSALSLSGCDMHHTYLAHYLWDVLLPPLILCLCTGHVAATLRFVRVHSTALVYLVPNSYPL